MKLKYTIWNCDTARPVRSGLPRDTAMRYAGLLERLFGLHYTVVRS